MEKRKSISWLIPFFILTISFLAYLPSLPNNFVWDDHFRIENNQAMQNFSNITKIFSPKTYNQTAVEPTFRPVVVIIRFINHIIWGKWATGHRLVNIFFHLLTVFLFYFLALRLLKNRLAAGLAALLVGIHPLQTEPVIMIAFHADILAGFFSLAAILAYWRFSENRKQWGFYLLSIFSCFLAMLSKEIAIVLPVILIVFEALCFETGTSSNLKSILNKSKYYLGFFLTAILFYWLRFKIFVPGAEYYAQYYQPTIPEILGTSARLFLIYLTKFLWPLRLSHWEPFQRSTNIGLPESIALLSALLFLVLLIVSLLHRKNKVFLGLFWFLIFIGPMLQLVPTGTPFFERWMYIPIMGLSFALFGFLLPLFSREKILKYKAFYVIIPIVFSLLFIRTWVRCYDWKNDITLWRSAITADPGNYGAMMSLASNYGDKSDYDKMLYYLKKALQIGPRDPNLLASLASYYDRNKNYPMVIKYGTLALRYGIPPQKKIAVDRPYFVNVAMQQTVAEGVFSAYLKSNRQPEALAFGQKISRVVPSPIIHYEMGKILESQNQAQLAQEHYRVSLKLIDKVIDVANTGKIKPEIYLLLNGLYEKMPTDRERIIPLIERGHREYPVNMQIRYNLSQIYRQIGKTDLALKLERNLVRLDLPALLSWSRSQPPRSQGLPPTEAIQLLEYAKSLQMGGDFPKSIEMLDIALSRFPSWDQLYLELGSTYAQAGQKQAAVDTWAKGIRINPFNPYFYAHMGYIFAELGDNESAKILWLRALELKPDFEELREMMKDL